MTFLVFDPVLGNVSNLALGLTGFVNAIIYSASGEAEHTPEEEVDSRTTSVDHQVENMEMKENSLNSSLNDSMEIASSNA